MKWQSHRLIGISAAIFFDGGIIAAALSYVGSTLPDVVEGRSPGEGAWFYKKKMKAWRATHRGTSHWAIWYVLLAMVGSHYHPVLAWLGFGALTHLAADSLTPMGIPLYPFSKRTMLSLNLFSTGSVKEYLFSILLLAAIVYYSTTHINRLHLL